MEFLKELTIIVIFCVGLYKFMQFIDIGFSSWRGKMKKKQESKTKRGSKKSKD